MYVCLGVGGGQGGGGGSGGKVEGVGGNAHTLCL